MSTLVIEGMKKQIVTEYEHASQEEKLQVNKVIEDIFVLWGHRHTDNSEEGSLWQAMEDFIREIPTFPLNWKQNKLTREEMNAR